MSLSKLLWRSGGGGAWHWRLLPCIIVAILIEENGAFQSSFIRTERAGGMITTATRTLPLSSPPPHPELLPPFDRRTRQPSMSLKALTFSNTLAAAAESSWKDYSVLIVSCLIILDVALGQPFVNAVMGPIRQRALEQQGEEKEEAAAAGTSPPATTTTSKSSSASPSSLLRRPSSTSTAAPSLQSFPGEVVDSAEMARQGLEQAQALLDLRSFQDKTADSQDVAIAKMQKKVQQQLEQDEWKKQQQQQQKKKKK